MRKTVIKRFIKVCTAFIIIFLVCKGYEINTSHNKFKNSLSAEATDTQYIPDKLDYSEIIKYIKKEEGIKDENTKHEAEKNDDTSLTNRDKVIIPEEYLNKATEIVKEAINITDEDTKRTKIKTALFYYKEYLKYNPGDLEGLLGAGVMSTFLKREEEAKNFLMEAYATYPKNARVHKALGDYSFKFSNYNNAIEYYNLSLLSGNIEDFGTNLATAICYEKLGDIEKAITYFKVAHYLNPDSEFVNKRIEMYAKMQADGYSADSRVYEDAFKPDEKDDIELETLILDAHQIK